MNCELQNRKRVLLVEDNEKIMAGNKWMFQRHGYDTAVALTLHDARKSVSERKPDAIVLDIMLPDGNGLEFMRELRENRIKSKNCNPCTNCELCIVSCELQNVPVLLLTGLTTKEDVLRGIKMGGDDYLTKPYDFDILMARVERLLERAGIVPEVITKGCLSLDVTAGVAMCDGIDLLLTQKEFLLLLVFVQNEGRFIDGGYLYEKVWKAMMTGCSQAVRKTASNLRGKIKESGWTISWSKGEGYIFMLE